MNKWSTTPKRVLTIIISTLAIVAICTVIVMLCSIYIRLNASDASLKRNMNILLTEKQIMPTHPVDGQVIHAAGFSFELVGYQQLKRSDHALVLKGNRLILLPQADLASFDRFEDFKTDTKYNLNIDNAAEILEQASHLPIKNEYDYITAEYSAGLKNLTLFNTKSNQILEMLLLSKRSLYTNEFSISRFDNGVTKGFEEKLNSSEWDITIYDCKNPDKHHILAFANFTVAEIDAIISTITFDQQ